MKKFAKSNLFASILNFEYSASVLHNSVFVLLLFGFTSAVFAQWSHNPTINTPICAILNYQGLAAITSDGHGGAIIVWVDERGPDRDIYAQRVDADGFVHWAANGIAICKLPDIQAGPVIIDDGVGGAIIAWVDYRNGKDADIYAQRIDANGTVKWTADGVPICKSPNDQINPAIVIDGAGGAIIAWGDNPSISDWNIYAQRIDANGNVQWTNNGVAICTASNTQWIPVIVSDNAGGAIVAWDDSRGSDWDIYAQRIDGYGNVQWTTNGKSICQAANDQGWLAIASDGVGGAIIAWKDLRRLYKDSYAQRIDAFGAVQWTNNGVPICTAADDLTAPVIASDGSGGAIIAWEDYRSGSTVNIYAQRIIANGAVIWPANGVVISTDVTSPQWPTIASDGTGGAIITWEDARGNDIDIYVQKINSIGLVQWPVNGVAISTAADDQGNQVMTGDGFGGAIIAWQDRRSGFEDIYAQKVFPKGYLANQAPEIARVRDVINDQGGLVSVLWFPSPLDVWPDQTITSYWIWRGLKLTAAQNNVIVLEPQAFRKRVASKGNLMDTYMMLPGITSNRGPIFWELIDSVDTRWLHGYSFNVPTLSDSGSQGVPWHYFMISAQTGDPLVFWDSPPDSGYSIDNLAPLPPIGLIASVVNNTVELNWQESIEPDLNFYIIYRNGNVYDSSLQNKYTDTDVQVEQSYNYKLKAVDIHENKSEFSEEVTVILTQLEDTDELNLPKVFQLSQNYPNPFNLETLIQYQLPFTSHVELSIYNVAGQKIRTLVKAQENPDYYRVYWEGKDADGLQVPSGVYLYQLRASEFIQTRRMILLK